MPTSSQRIGSLAVLALILVGGAFVLWQLADDSVAPGPGDGGASRPEPLDVGKGPAGDTGAPPKPPPQGSAADLDKAGCTVELTLEKLADVLPAPTHRPECLLVVNDNAPRSKARLGTYVAGLAALPAAREVAGWQLIRFPAAFGDDAPTYRMTRLTRAHRDLASVSMLLGPQAHQGGFVRDESARPVRGAEVWLGGRRAKTDETGRFLFEPARAQDGLPIVVRKPGFVPHYDVLTAADFHALDEPTNHIVLRRGVSLTVYFASGVGADARFWLLPAGGRDSRWVRYPFFMHALETGYTLRDGAVVFDGLPRGAKVRVRMVRPGFVPVTSPEIVLDQDANGARVTVTATRRIRGIVLRADGEPLESAFVTSRGRGGSSVSLRHETWLLPPGAYVEDAAVTRTGADGRFELSPASEGRSTIAVEAEGFLGIAHTVAAESAGEVRITMFPAVARGEPRLEIEAGKGLPPVARLVVREGKQADGPYAWRTANAFPLSVARRGVYRVRIRIDDGKVMVQIVAVAAPTRLVVRR